MIASCMIFSQLELSCVNHIFMLMKANMMKGNIIIGYTSANPMKSYSTSFMKKRKRMTQTSSTTKIFSFLCNCKMISKNKKKYTVDPPNYRHINDSDSVAETFSTRPADTK